MTPYFPILPNISNVSGSTKNFPILPNLQKEIQGCFSVCGWYFKVSRGEINMKHIEELCLFDKIVFDPIASPLNIFTQSSNYYQPSNQLATVSTHCAPNTAMLHLFYITGSKMFP